MACVPAWSGFLSVEFIGRIHVFFDVCLNMGFVNVMMNGCLTRPITLQDSNQQSAITIRSATTRMVHLFANCNR